MGVMVFDIITNWAYLHFLIKYIISKVSEVMALLWGIWLISNDYDEKYKIYMVKNIK